MGFAFCCVLRSSWAQQAPEFGENDESSDVGFGGVTPGPELQVLESVSPNVDGIMMSSSPETESEIIVSSPEGDEDALVTSMPDVEGIIGKGDKGLFVDECLSDTECGKDEYCFLNYADTRGCVTGACDIRPRVCLKRKEINVGCNLTLECEEGLYCENGIGVGKMVCKERIALGEACKRFSEDGCEVGLNCLGEGEKGICGVLKKAEAGESCLNVECKEGLFCDESGSGMGGFNKKCAKTHIEGEKCTPFSSGQCEDGFCMSDFKGSEQFGVCIKFPGVGGPCLFDTDCMSLEPDPIFGRSPPVVCNLSKNPLFGTCINETALIKEPGADCEANLDACDGRRGLACEEIDSKYVCVQRVDIGGRGSRACTPGSPHSFCDKSDSQGRSPTECRRALGLNSKTAYGTSQCLAKIEVVTKGEICNKEDFVVCEDGTSCEVGPGIGIRDPSPRDIVYPVRYCMKKIPAGGNCASKFEVTCKEGSTCVAGVCSATAALVKVPETMAGFFDDCSTMPCAPGLVCKSQEFRPVKQVCQAPAVMVGAGEACASNGTVSKVSFEISSREMRLASSQYLRLTR